MNISEAIIIVVAAASRSVVLETGKVIYTMHVNLIKAFQKRKGGFHLEC